MTNMFNDKLADLGKIYLEQNNQVSNEIDGSVDAWAHANEQRDIARRLAKAKREEADQIEAAAEREYQATMTAATTALISVRQQLAAGQMVTGSTSTPTPRKPKPKLVADEEAA